MLHRIKYVILKFHILENCGISLQIILYWIMCYLLLDIVTYFFLVVYNLFKYLCKFSLQTLDKILMWYTSLAAATAAAKLLQSCPTLCDPLAAHQAPPSLGFSKQEHWSGFPFPSPVPESEKWKWSRSVVSNS